jgi:type II secretory pathway component GspD/PulD (secretin)
MFARCRAVCMLLAVLLAASAAQAGEGRLVLRTYAVSDLVVTADIESESTTSDAQLIKRITETISPHSWSSKGGRGTIDFYPTTMALVVNQTLEVQDQIVDLLAALRRRQEREVRVEVKFVEIAEELFQDLKCKGLLGKQHMKKHAPDNVTFLDDAGVFRFFETVQSDPRSNVMQAPRMTTFNGKKMGFDAVETRKFVTGVEIVRGDKGVQYQQKVEVIPLGVQLSLQPIISVDGRFVRVHLKANLTNLDSSDVLRLPPTLPAPNGESGTVTWQIEVPEVIKMGVDRTMTIPDGNTAVLTGLMKQRTMATAVEVPILSQIPVVGRIFRSIGYSCEKHPLLVLVTPRIVVPQEQEKKHSHKDDFRTLVLPPYREDDPHCSEAPDEGRILRALPPLRRLAGVYEESRDNVQIVTERIVDKIDPPRFFPLVGRAQLHHCHWKCTVYYNETITCNYPFTFRWSRIGTHVVYIDSDHLHTCPTDVKP